MPQAHDKPAVVSAYSVPSSNCEDEKERLIARILQNPRIPSPPGFALQVFQRAGQEDCKAHEISELLAHDPGLCAKILRTLNSAVYGQSKPVTSVQQAVTMMGMRPLRSLVLGLTLPVMQANVKSDAGLQKFWMKSLTGAILARELAKRCRTPAPDDVMATSLLRDLGMILLHQTFQHSYDPIWMGTGDITAEGQCDWEEHFLGVHHAELSAALLERWQLPIEISEPIRFHHHPELMPALVRQLSDRAKLLDFVTRLTDLQDGSRFEGGIEGILNTASKQYDFKRDELETFLGAIRPKVEEFSNILCVDIGHCPDFDELLSTGCEAMVHLSLETGKATTPDPKPIQRGTVGDETIRDLVADPENVKSGSHILHYEVVEVIGRGAMGIVLKAFDPGLGRHVAIKLLAPEMAGNEMARKRFALEARFAAALRHEHVVAIYGVHELDGVPFLVMEFVPGSSLGDLLDDGRPFSLGEIARISRQTALGLAAAHEARLIHRDIKPANLLVEEGTLHVRVADFGLARAIDENLNLSHPGLLLGTPTYMSPEQVDDKPLTAASDLFSLGSVIYTLCTGQLPFQAQTMSGLLNAVALKTPTPIRELNSAIPEGLADIVEKLHAKNPAERPPSAFTVAASLEPWIALR